METLLQEDDKSNNNPAENSILSYDYILDSNMKKVTTVANKYSNGQIKQEYVGEEMFDLSVYQGTRPSINTEDTIAAYKSAANFAGDTVNVTSRMIDIIAEETASFVDNVPGYMNKYNPLPALAKGDLANVLKINIPDNENVWFNLNNSGKGPVRNAWDYYRKLGGIYNNSFAPQQLEEGSTGELIAQVGSELVPWLYGVNIIKAPAKVEKYGTWATNLYKWGAAGFATDFVYGDMDYKSAIPFTGGTTPTEAAGKLMQTIGFDPKDEPMIKNLLHYSFLDGDDAEMFANKLDHAFNAGIVDGTFGVLFAGIGNVWRNGVAKFFPEYATAQYFAKPFIRDHGTKFEKFKKNFDTAEEATYKYFAQPELKTWMMNQHMNGRTFGVLSKSFDRKYNEFLQSLKTKAGYGDVLGPMQLGSGTRYTAPTQGSYDFAKQNLLNVYKYLQKNKNPLMLWLGGGAAFTTLFGNTNAEAGVLDKAIQKVFEKGGQRLFTRGVNNKLIPMTHDDVLNMPLDKEVIIQPMDDESNWIVHKNKDVYLQSDDGFAANPLDLLPNQKYPYYDTLAQKIDGMNFETMPKEQFINTINNMPGIKKEEIETTELIEFVNDVDGDVVSKNALLTDWYDNSKITLTTRTLGSDTGSGEMEEAYGKYEEQTMPGQYDKYKEHILKFNKQLSLVDADSLKLSESMITADDLKIEYVIGTDVVSIGNTILPTEPPVYKSTETVNLFDKDGNIIEPLHTTRINVPAKGTEEFEKLKKEREQQLFRYLVDRYNLDVKRKFMKNKTFQSSHFDESNVLLHTRTNERIASDGQPLLFLEELQSDWHQAGRQRGYLDKDVNIKINNLKNRVDKIQTRLKEIRTETVNLLDVDGDEYFNLQKELYNLEEQIGLVTERNRSKVVDAPFKDTNSWTQLGLKKMVNYAASKGYTRLAWTPGSVQNERYSLSSYFDSIFVEKIRSGIYDGQYLISGNDKRGNRDINRRITEAQLPNTVGKEFAKKIIDEAATYPDGHTYEGLDLEIGGQGMVNFYDKMIPNNLKKLYAKDGVEFGEIELGDQKLGTYAMNENFSAPAAPNNFVYEIFKNEIYDFGGNQSLIELNTLVMNDETLYNDFIEYLVQQVDEVEYIDNTGNLAKSNDVDTIIENISDFLQESYFIEWLATYGVEPSKSYITVQYMTIPESLKDRVLKLGQPLFGTNPSQLGAYENKTTQ